MGLSCCFLPRQVIVGPRAVGEVDRNSAACETVPPASALQRLGVVA